jgi:DNA invertase Pin-like site-specific DNA recombinase
MQKVSIKIPTNTFNKDVNLKVLHQNIDTTSPAGRLLFTMLGAIAEFERDLINERVREGIEAAKKKGVQFDYFI